VQSGTYGLQVLYTLILLYTLYSILLLYTLYSILHTLTYYTPHTPHTSYTILHTPYSIHHTPHTIHHTPHSTHHKPHTPHNHIHHIQVKAVRFTSNIAALEGGGAYIATNNGLDGGFETGNTLTFENCIFTSNMAACGGGLFFDVENSAFISNTLFNHNKANDSGTIYSYILLYSMLYTLYSIPLLNLHNTQHTLYSIHHTPHTIHHTPHQAAAWPSASPTPSHSHTPLCPTTQPNRAAGCRR
jgi:hypothetical protein